MRSLNREDTVWDDRRPYFDPEAPGIRGMIGVLLGVFRLIWERIRALVAEYVYAFNELPARVRGLVLVLLAFSLLVIVGSLVIGEVVSTINERNVPILEDALIVPYDIADRGEPDQNKSASDLLPRSFGGYVMLSDAIPEGAIVGLPVKCLMDAYPEDAESTCELRHRVIEKAYGRYGKDTAVHFDVVVTRFENADAAGRVMQDLLGYYRTVGQVGNFSVTGITSVDFMYSAADGLLSFTWRRGLVVFNLSAQTYSQMEAGVEAFPY